MTSADTSTPHVMDPRIPARSGRPTNPAWANGNHPNTHKYANLGVMA